MNSSPPGIAGPSSSSSGASGAAEERRARAARALRENLRRRKARDRAGDGGKDKPFPKEEAPSSRDRG